MKKNQIFWNKTLRYCMFIPKLYSTAFFSKRFSTFYGINHCIYTFYSILSKFKQEVISFRKLSLLKDIFSSKKKNSRKRKRFRELHAIKYLIRQTCLSFTQFPVQSQPQLPLRNLQCLHLQRSCLPCRISQLLRLSCGKC